MNHIIISSSTKKHSKQNHSIQRSWFSDHKWLTYCTTRNSLYCFHCRKKIEMEVLRLAQNSRMILLQQVSITGKKDIRNSKSTKKSIPRKKHHFHKKCQWDLLWFQWLAQQNKKTRKQGERCFLSNLNPYNICYVKAWPSEDIATMMKVI